MKNLRWLLYSLPLVFLVILGVFLWKGLSVNPANIPSALIDKPIPRFSAHDLLTGKNQSSNVLRGHVAMLNVWATWCEPCRQEYPVLLAISHQAKVPLYGLDYKDNSETASNWLREYGNPFIVSWEDPDGKIGVEWGIHGVPETFLIDKKGVIRYRHTGVLTGEIYRNEFLTRIEVLQNEK